MTAPIDELAARRALKTPPETDKSLVGVTEVNGALELYFRQGSRSVVVPVSLERAEEHAGDILSLVKEVRGR